MTSNPQNPFPAPVAQPPRRLSPESISGKVTEVAELSARLAKLGDELDAAVADISGDLTDVARKRRERELREAFAAAVVPLVARLAEHRDDLAAQAQFCTRDAVRSRSTHGTTADALQSAQLGAYWLARVGKASVTDLREIARDAAGRFDLALCVAVENEVVYRGLTGDQAEEIIGLCASVPLPSQDAAAAQKIADGYGAAELARLAAEERSTGESRSVERMNAAFAAAAMVGKLRPPAIPSAVAPGLAAAT